MDSQHADMYCFEDKSMVLGPLRVNVGANGFGLGTAQKAFAQTDILKYEGDKRTPIGIYPLQSVFGYEAKQNTAMPYIHATKEVICVDDADSPHYNRIIKRGETLPKSFEEMRRDDGQYELGVVIGYNEEQAKGRGSCIFLHVEKFSGSPTAGCTSMSYEDMSKVVKWLDINKNPKIIQITKEQLKEAKELYGFIEF